MELIDIGCNLTHDSFGDDLDEVVAQARAAGVVQFIVTGASNQGMQRASELARERPGIFYSTAGVHPHHADTFTEETETVIRQLVEREEVVAVGETGLDYFRDFSPRDAQRSAFERHIGIAADTGMPMFLHLRDAHEDFHAMLRESRDRLSDVVVHCFTGSREELHAYLDLDCHIGITGWICDERRGTHMKAFMKDIPADRLMIETDAPYLMPRTIQPKPKTRRNEPMYLTEVLRVVADARGQTEAHVASRLNRSTSSLQRDLRAEGTTFRQLLEGTRRDMAERLLTKEPDLIIEFQVDHDMGTIIMDKFRQANIPVIAVDIPMVGATFFGADNYKAGRLAGEDLIQQSAKAPDVAALINVLDAAIGLLRRHV